MSKTNNEQQQTAENLSNRSIYFASFLSLEFLRFILFQIRKSVFKSINIQNKSIDVQ